MVVRATPRDREARLTAAEVRRLLHYESDSGTFFWRVDTRNTATGDMAGSRQSRGYWHIKINRRLYMAHRLAWLYVTGEWPIGHIEHVNGNRSDNRFANLRVATNSENAWNSRICVNNACGYKGVHYKKRLKKFVAQINVDGRVYHLGVFKTATEAHAAYCKAAKEYFGEFARVA
jgi:hypothetical protein